MNLPLEFSKARIAGVVLAKIGNPARQEALQTSKNVFQVAETDQKVLAPIFLRPFRNLTGHRFQHHTALEQHALNLCAKAVFEDPSTLLKKGQEIAERLYAKSNHPNIKSGDLCIARLEGLSVDGQAKQAICILKSESVMPFLSISAEGEDLALHTERGIHPERLDKGCLIVSHFEAKGFYVLNFDRAGAESRFWMRDFLGVVPIADPGLVTRRVAEMTVAAVSGDGDSQDDQSAWERQKAAREALEYFDGHQHFSLAEFEEKALRTPEARARFAEEKQRAEQDEGLKFDDGFAIAKREASKARRLTAATMRLDCGVDLRIRPQAVEAEPSAIEKGYDPEKGMKFIKIYYEREL